MSLRARFMEDLKAAMKAGQSGQVATLRMVNAKLKDADIVARARGAEVSEDEIVSMLRGMIKSRTESAAMYQQGGRPELAEKEEAEIAIIRAYLPAELDAATLEAAAREAIGALGAASMKDMGKVMGALKARFGAALDAGQASAVVKSLLSA
ncbi:GatB/YqeY domain-containing protein [Gluconacetobacter takamatsuzukensis]|uniref:GatB/YqeY domain-containing protein n=1 Tax=Gluconacetobacter takamatsuzukensis TaxID=1286190 RepID=A0A7W4PN52_9PROT|nr:GatB/YqeY domain-containing protein [Gluconacetobacter takamatsuzukensis]MBB2203693.1 GatB/YqeY domain-containing protein [Gluconacetobacter takamatsuzukensis]